jgi:elongation factor 1-alpha
MGHVNHGKSSLVGYLLYALGEIDKREIERIGEEAKRKGREDRKLAWVLDIERDPHKETEDKRSIRTHFVTFQTENFNVNVIDIPGHHTWVPKGIRGVVESDTGLLVVSAKGEDFVEGLKRYKLKGDRYFIGQAREYAFIAATLGLLNKIIVVISKIDTVNYSHEKYEEVKYATLKVLKEYGFNEEMITFIPTSVNPFDVTGENVTKKSEKMPWYKGYTLLQAIDHISPPPPQVNKPLRFFIDRVFKQPPGVTIVVKGSLKTGKAKKGDKLLIEPPHIAAEVKSIRTRDREELEALAGTMPTIGLRGNKGELTEKRIGKSPIAGHLENPPKVASEFIGDVYILWYASPIKKGFQCVVHIAHQMTSCQISELIEKMSITTNISEDTPNTIWTGDKAKIKVSLESPLCAELFKEIPPIGTFFLRTQGITIAAGVITEIMERREKGNG